MPQIIKRNEYLRNQKEIYGRRLVGVFPAQYPKEILWALDILPVEIWDPPLEIENANAHLQPMVCGIVKSGLELILQGKTENLDGFLFPHTCDSLQNLSSIVSDFLKPQIPCFFFYHPRAPYRESSKIFYTAQLKNLTKNLEKHFGKMKLGALERSVILGQKLDSTIRKIYEIRASGKLAISNFNFYKILRKGGFLHPDDFLEILKNLISGANSEITNQRKIILSGVLPNPLEILSKLDDLKITVAGDDFINGSRRLICDSAENFDPFEALTEKYFSLPPCSTKSSGIDERFEYLFKMIENSGASGVIFNITKFCEPELFYLPMLKKRLKKAGIPSLVIETDLNSGLSGQLATRLEAFAEMLG